MIAKMKLKSTPPNITRSLCHAALLLNSHGCGSFFKCSVSMDSSIMPATLQYPPSGSQPIPYSVSQFLAFGNSLENQPSLVLSSLTPLASKKRKNLSTLIPNSLEKKKCPNSWTTISIDKASTTCNPFVRIIMFCFVRMIFCRRFWQSARLLLHRLTRLTGKWFQDQDWLQNLHRSYIHEPHQ